MNTTKGPAVSTQAWLQRRILATLARGGLPSVVAIAQEVGSGRPSASRSVHQLETRGLVSREDGEWRLTDAGRSAARAEARQLAATASRVLAASQQTEREVRRRLPAATTLSMSTSVPAGTIEGLIAGLESTNRSLVHGLADHHTGIAGGVPASTISGVLKAAESALSMSTSVPAGTIAGLIAGLESTNRSLVHGIAAQNVLRIGGGPASITGMLKAAEALNIGTSVPVGLIAGLESTNRSLVHGLADHYAGIAFASSAVFDALRFQTNALQHLTPVARSVVAANLAVTGRIAADVDSIAAALPARRDISSRSAGRLDVVIGQVVGAHRDVLTDVLPNLASPTTAAWEVLLGTTRTTSSFTSTARLLAVENAPAAAEDEAIADLVADVAGQLAGVGAKSAARDLAAAYEQQRMRPEGWEKATAHLQREAVRGMLDELAPPAGVPRDSAGIVTKRAQLRVICRDDQTLTEWVDVTATSVGKLHSFLSAEAKRLAESRLGPEGHSGLLLVTAGILRVVLDQASRNKTQ